MLGLSSSSKEAIAKAVEKMFDQIANQFIGYLPGYERSKSIVFGYTPNNGLVNLFIQAMGNRHPSVVEKDVLKNLLQTADGYVEALKLSTKTSVAERVDVLARTAKLNGESLSEDSIREILADEMKKASSKLQAIAEAESTKVRNMGSTVDIGKMAGNMGDTDPTVFFVVTRDSSTCSECIRLHLMPDKVTPKLWKLSQLKGGYHKRGEDVPSICGEHPHCRCTLTYLARGYSFNKHGYVEYRAQEHDEYAVQAG